MLKPKETKKDNIIEMPSAEKALESDEAARLDAEIKKAVKFSEEEKEHLGADQIIYLREIRKHAMDHWLKKGDPPSIFVQEVVKKAKKNVKEKKAEKLEDTEGRSQSWAVDGAQDAVVEEVAQPEEEPKDAFQDDFKDDLF